jgi:hypothetical protein
LSGIVPLVSPGGCARASVDALIPLGTRQANDAWFEGSAIIRARPRGVKARGPRRKDQIAAFSGASRRVARRFRPCARAGQE